MLISDYTSVKISWCFLVEELTNKTLSSIAYMFGGHVPLFTRRGVLAGTMASEAVKLFLVL